MESKTALLADHIAPEPYRAAPGLLAKSSLKKLFRRRNAAVIWRSHQPHPDWRGAVADLGV